VARYLSVSQVTEKDTSSKLLKEFQISKEDIGILEGFTPGIFTGH
jgi:hypothetical protein